MPSFTKKKKKKNYLFLTSCHITRGFHVEWYKTRPLINQDTRPHTICVNYCVEKESVYQNIDIKQNSNIILRESFLANPGCCLQSQASNLKSFSDQSWFRCM